MIFTKPSSAILTPGKGHRRFAAAIALCLPFIWASAAPAYQERVGFAAGVSAYRLKAYNVSARVMLRLARRGDARAQTYLGFMYATGMGVPQNFSEAAYWMRLAADHGRPEAQYLLGLMYDKGQGVPSDFIRAEAWLILAVAHAGPSERDAWTRVRDAIANKMKPADRDFSQALALEWRPGARSNL